MILTCPTCSTRLQLETTKLPTRAFSIKCPKCQNMLSISPPEGPADESATSAPATTTRTAPPPPLVEDQPSLAESKLPKLPAELTSAPGESEHDPIKTLASMLASAFAQSGGKPGDVEQTRRRRMLLCLSSDAEVKKVRSLLQGHDYELMVVEASEQAIECLQVSNQVDLVLLDPNFEEDHQGSTAVLRFISSLSPARRRRLYAVMISSTFKTLDTQTAFFNGVNLLINSAELVMLPLALNKGIREFNLLYRAYNEASGLSPF